MKLPSPSSSESIINIQGLCKQFDKKDVLKDITLQIPQGCVFGLVGENGAGKTTTIRHILGLLRPDAGTVSVFDRNPIEDPEKVLSRIGYLSEFRDLPAWMRVEELMHYTRAFYPDWDPAFAEELREDFGLDPAKRIRELSQGQQAKAGLLVALAYRPELLVLDEPSSGLDPVVRRDMLETIIRTVANEGRTVFFSSHLLDEIERVSDYLAMIHQGRLKLTGRLDDLRESHRQLDVQFEHSVPGSPRLEKALEWTGQGRHWSALCRLPLEGIRREISQLGGTIVEETIPRLDQIFFATVRNPGRKRQA